jgi:hypothetical protein
MKPLGSPVLEYRIEGALQVLVGIAIAGVAASARKPIAVGAAWIVGAAIFGGLMYLLTYRRFLTEAVRDAAEVPADATYESVGATCRRVAIRTLGTTAPLVALALLLPNPTLVGAIATGNGAALLLLSRWVDHWQRTHTVRLVKEPRYRWRRVGKRRGRGIMDSRDFYVGVQAGVPPYA